MADSKINWKGKYLELREKYLRSIDTAFKLGVEEGMRESEIAQLQDQVAQMEQEAAAAQMGQVDENGMPIEGEMPVDENGMPIEGEMPIEEVPGEEGGFDENADLDSSIEGLEGMVKKEKFDITRIMKGMHKSEVKSETKKTPTKDKLDKLFKSIDSE